MGGLLSSYSMQCFWCPAVNSYYNAGHSAYPVLLIYTTVNLPHAINNHNPKSTGNTALE